MDHNEAIQQMATEKYILGEMSPELRDAFEEHFFDCQECALDLRTAAAFVNESKTQLPDLTGPLSTPVSERAPRRVDKKEKKQSFFSWWRPAFAAPVFAVLLLVIGYQNIVTLPALRSAESEPVISSTVYLHSGTRSGEHVAVDVNRNAGRNQGITLAVDRPQLPGYASFNFELYDPQGKLLLDLPAPSDGFADGTVSLAIPGAGLKDGAYTLAISGLAANGDRTEIERHTLDFHLKN